MHFLLARQPVSLKFTTAARRIFVDFQQIYRYNELDRSYAALRAHPKKAVQRHIGKPLTRVVLNIWE